MIKVFLRIILVLISLVVILYFIFMFLEGGFGKKPATILPVKNENVPLLFAHRGVTTGFPENSRGAIEQAKKLKFKGLEVDIRKSADQEFILFHDEDALRLLGTEGKVAELTLAQLKNYRLLFNKDTSISKVLTLKELLDEYRDDFVIYLDMKLKGMNDVDELIHLIWTYDISSQVIVASTNPMVIFYLEYNYPALQTALEGFNAGKEWIYYLIPKNLKPDFYSSFADKVNNKHMEWLKKQDLLSSRIVYGVDSTNYQALVDLGLKNMIIDYWPALQVP
ncbi:MAG: glycerophosphodiester phosphodiesterase family protein [Bacteroidales bacterium]|nr:glycerophosphodiester phosphodiesterase family protein [Bacteroidales bacterium]